MPRIVGLDLSLTSTGVAIIVTGDGREQRHVDRIQSTGRATATLQDRTDRLGRLLGAVLGAADDADLVLVEGPSFGSKGGQAHDRSGLWWLAMHYLDGRGHTVVEIPPSSRMKYATGKGNAAKDAVLAAVVRRYPQIEVTGNDEADALVIAAMGARWLGHPIDDLPKDHLKAMTAIHWPARKER